MTKETSTTRPLTRYHLRSRANSTPAQPVAIPGTYIAPSVAQTEASSSEVGHTPTSPLTSLSQQTESSEVARPVLYSQVASSIPSVELSAPEVSVTSSLNGISHIFSTLSLREKDQGLVASVEEVTDEGEPSTHEYVTAGSGPWTEVRYGKQAKSPTNNGTAARPRPIDCTPEQLDELANSVQYKNSGETRTHRPPSRGEGTSNHKGKITDPRNWGGVNIPAAELDLELQRKALEFYSKYHQGQPLNLPSDLSDEEKDEGIQRVTLDHWEANKLGANPGTALRAASDSAASREEQLLQEVDTLREELHRARLALDAAKGSAEATLATPGKLHSASNARVTADTPPFLC
ncbi:hypothetical protein PHLCEN_2v6801 [Hermanssonia centrifuga]|uniref:Uncharacterized protein n=1 Tax=Hermanssonia centrifuga TaxID=98765 RepID=A0A2R6NYE1_9APHY|nr:hypothetical protein PHLCEN_2v6801 [Hermanssonia centrifuga]